MKTKLPIFFVYVSVFQRSERHTEIHRPQIPAQRVRRWETIGNDDRYVTRKKRIFPIKWLCLGFKRIKKKKKKCIIVCFVYLFCSLTCQRYRMCLARDSNNNYKRLCSIEIKVIKRLFICHFVQPNWKKSSGLNVKCYWLWTTWRSTLTEKERLSANSMTCKKN